MDCSKISERSASLWRSCTSRSPPTGTSPPPCPACWSGSSDRTSLDSLPRYVGTSASQSPLNLAGRRDAGHVANSGHRGQTRIGHHGPAPLCGRWPWPRADTATAVAGQLLNSPRSSPESCPTNAINPFGGRGQRGLKKASIDVPPQALQYPATGGSSHARGTCRHRPSMHLFAPPPLHVTPGCQRCLCDVVGGGQSAAEACRQDRLCESSWLTTSSWCRSDTAAEVLSAADPVASARAPTFPSPRPEVPQTGQKELGPFPFCVCDAVTGAGLGEKPRPGRGQAQPDRG
jgi:hypothetical protein